MLPFALTFQLSKSLKAQLSAKIVCANFVATEGMSDTKYKPILDSYEKLGVNAFLVVRGMAAMTRPASPKKQQTLGWLTSQQEDQR